MQKNEVTEHLIYIRLARRVKDKEDSDILLRIADESCAMPRSGGSSPAKKSSPIG